MRWIPTVALLLAGAACQTVPDAAVTAPEGGQPQPAPTASAQPPAPPPCTSYTIPVTVGGQPQQAVVEACQKADGSWRITQTTPGLPPQVYELPPPAYAPYSEAYPYPDFFPYWWGSSWFFGLAPSIILVNRFNHFHHGFHHGFGHGFAHGFGHFGHGFGHGFAAAHGGGGMAGGHR